MKNKSSSRICAEGMSKNMSAEFDKLAGSYDNWHENLIKGSGFSREYFLEYKVKETAKALAGQGINPKNILDFGCGVGDVEPYLQKYFPDAKIFAVDISADSIETAKKTAEARGLSGITFAALDEAWISNNFLSRFEKFDLVFAAGVFHHIPPSEHSKILSAIEKQMCKNAKIFIFELNPLNPATRHVFAKYEKPVDKHANLISPSAFKKAMKSCGLRTSRTFYTIFFPHALKIFIPLEKHLSRVPFGAHYFLLGEKGEKGGKGEEL